MKKSPKICFSTIKTQKNLRANFWNGVVTLETEKKFFLTYKGLFKKNFFFCPKSPIFASKRLEFGPKTGFFPKFWVFGLKIFKKTLKTGKNWIFLKKLLILTQKMEKSHFFDLKI